MSKVKMQYCFNCGVELGVYAAIWGEPDSCGARECDREARNEMAAEREDAHEQLNRDRGWA